MGAITGVGGSAIHGQTLTIIGTGFGTKTQAAPIKFETFEDGTLDARVDSDGYWTQRPTSIANFVNNIVRNSRSTQSVKASYPNGVNVDSWFYRNNIGFTTTAKAYVNMWMYIEYTAGPTGGIGWQVKNWRANSDGDNHNSRPNVTCTTYSQGDDASVEHSRSYQSSSADGLSDKDQVLQYAGNGQESPTKTWLNVSFAWEASTPDIADGNVYYWTSDAPTGDPINARSQLNTQTRSTATNVNIDSLALGYTIEVNAEIAYTYWDNIYIDNSWARVEVGDEAVYTNCKTREIQPPTAWAAGEVTVTVNQGSFANGSAYIFVIDEDGTASAGFEITFGDAAPTTATATGMSFSGVSVS